MDISDLTAKRIYISPFNNISQRLGEFLESKGVEFISFIDSYKVGENIIHPALVNDYDLVIINSPNYWQEIAESFEPDKTILYKKGGKDFIQLDTYISQIKSEKIIDVLLLPFNKSNVYDLSIISRELKNFGISAAIVRGDTIDVNNLNEGLKENQDIKVVERDQVEYLNYKAILASADWVEYSCALIEKARKKGIITIGIVDGIEDFEDSDYDYERRAYERVEHVLLMGEDDQKFLSHKIDNTYIVGLPKMYSMYRESIFFPYKDRVVLNVNFTYGTFEQERDNWVDMAISVCKCLGLDYVIAQHHADRGIFDKNIVSQSNIYDTIKQSTIVISRFSTIILESLALGKPVVYFNPHNESVKLYKQPDGAFQIACNKNELENALIIGLKNKGNVRKEAEVFLNRKCNILSEVPPGKLAAYRIKNLLEESLPLSKEKNYSIDPRYISRSKYSHYDDIGCEDEWQLEVYLHALGIMVKNSFKTVIDIGCGSGYKLMTYLKAYDTTGYELEANVKDLKKLYPDRCWKISSFSETDNMFADLIICSDVIEHLTEPDNLLSYLTKQEFEYLLISTPDRNLLYDKTDPETFGPPRVKAHQREWNFKEFEMFISKYFNVLDHRITNYHQATQLVICKKKTCSI